MFSLNAKLDGSASICPNRGPMLAIMAEIACMGAESGPVRALRAR